MGAGGSSQQKFDFNYLYFATNVTVTYDVCVDLVGTGINWYDRKDVYDRVLLWRVPLLALWATTTLPAFGIYTQIFTLVHLIADPIDTIWSLLYKLDLARRTARLTERNDKTHHQSYLSLEELQTEKGTAGIHTTEKEVTVKKEQRAHDVPALIITAYDEWGCGDQACKAMINEL